MKLVANKRVSQEFEPRIRESYQNDCLLLKGFFQSKGIYKSKTKCHIIKKFKIYILTIVQDWGRVCMFISLQLAEQFDGAGDNPSSVLPPVWVVVSAVAGLCPPGAKGLRVVVSGGLPAEMVDVWQKVFVVTDWAFWFTAVCVETDCL